MQLNWFVLLPSVLVAFNAHAQSDLGRRIVLNGNGHGASACVTCHGATGEGNAQQGYPRLAGLNPDYLVRQIQAFKAGTRRNAIMQPIAQGLSDADAQAVARWYASQRVPPSAPPARTATTDLLRQGEHLATVGAWDKNVPACFDCHGPGAQGVGSLAPRLAGQHASYIANQLHAWKRGQRTDDPVGLMRAVAQKLNEQDIRAVSAYLATLPSAAPSGTRAGKSQSTGANSRVGLGPRYDGTFVPPKDSDIPNNQFGEMVRLGQNIFVDTQHYAKRYVGNALNCVNCHLDRGRKADASPMWAAYVAFPTYRSKNKKVNTMQDRIRGCFRFSENGTAPPVDSKEMTALVTYFYWLAQGAPTGAHMKGRGYPKLAPPKEKPDVGRGAQVFAANCAVCHGGDGQGTQVGNTYVFPPLWGPRSFNGGAGMHKVDMAAAFIRANMPYGKGGSLSEQQAWDVATFMNSHSRPPDPRKKK